MKIQICLYKVKTVARLKGQLTLIKEQMEDVTTDPGGKKVP